MSPREGVGPVRLLLVALASVWTAAVWTVGAFPGGASAHTLDTQGFSEISQQGNDVRYELLVDYAALAIVTGIGGPGAAEPEAGSYGSAAAELADGTPRVAEYLDRHLQVFADGVPCPAEITETGVQPRFRQPYARISLRYDCSGAGEYTIRYSVLVGDLDPGHSNVAGYDLSGGAGEFVFDADDTELQVGDQSLVRQAYRFAVLGFQHILGGWDHVLFVVALLVGATRVRDVLGVVTAFTVAHSGTLVLAATDLVRVSPSVVEPLIALSIAYVAVMSLLGRTRDRYRLAGVFGFGLLHGLGFAGALRFTGDVDGTMLSSLVSFNVGIELGQVLIVATLLPVFLLVRRFVWSRPLLFGVTSLIALAGLVWFVERLVLT